MARLRELPGVAADFTIGTLIVMSHFVAAGYRGREEQGGRLPTRRAAKRERTGSTTKTEPASWQDRISD